MGKNITVINTTEITKVQIGVNIEGFSHRQGIAKTTITLNAGGGFAEMK